VRRSVGLMQGKFAVLLATRNGQRFLDAQLRSLEQQDVNYIDVFASDDHSTDDTVEILKHWQRTWSKGDFRIQKGPGEGHARNFSSLLTSFQGSPDYVAFCDQDDMWDADKLRIGASTLDTIAPRSRPAVFGSRTRLIDAHDQLIGHSPLFARGPSFHNAIVQSFAGGNTMVLNRAAFELTAESARRTDFVTHDWWCYLIVTGAGGMAHYDREPRISYRQHGDNVIGSNNSAIARLLRVRQLVEGRFASWNAIHLKALDLCADLMCADALEVVRQFRAVRSTRGLSSVSLLRQTGIHRQTRLGNVALNAAAMLGKL